MRRFTLLLVAALSALSISAVPVDLEQARSVALRFIKSNFPQTRAGQEALTLVWTDGPSGTRSGADTGIASDATFYVFDRAEAPGFVVVAGDDAVYPILGYGEQRTFGTDGMPGNLRGWFDSYRRQISWLRDNNRSPSAATREAWEKLRGGSLQLESAGVLLTTVLWDQMAPYNNLCPVVGNQRTPTGCVATSTAIAMQYHRWPDVGQGSHSYTSKSYGLSLSASFDTPYQWDNMPATYTAGQYTAQQAQNVATLLFDCGVFSDMDYAPGNSGALTLTAAQGLVDYMKYDKSLHVLQRQNYQTAEWESVVKGELDNNRPVVYGGENDQNEGHQFVIDGYNTSGYYHVNWGWSGLADGYYLLAVLDPEEQGTGGNSGGGFSLDQMAIISMKKPAGDSSYEDILTFFYGEEGGIVFSGLTASTDAFEPNRLFDVQYGYVGNMSIRNFTGDLAFALVDKAGNTKEFISSGKSVSLEINRGVGGEMACTITQPILPGDRIRLLYKSSDATSWKWVRGGTDTTGEIPADGSDVATQTVPSAPPVTVSCDASRNLTVLSPVAIKEVRLYDAGGRLLKRQPAGGHTEVSLSCVGYPPGVYIAEVLTVEARSSHKLLLPSLSE